jgi:hypothetical protein
MKRNVWIWILSIILFLSGIGAGFLIRPAIIKSVNPDVPLNIIGDVEEPGRINDFNGLESIEKIENKGVVLKAVRLQKLIEDYKPHSDSNKIIFVSSDGLAASINSSDIEGCFITYSSNNGWEALNINHPISSNVKKITDIVISSENNAWDYGLNIISPYKNILNITPGQFFLKADSKYNYEGTSSVNKKNKDYKADIYRIKKELTINDLLMDYDLTVSGNNGSTGSNNDNSSSPLNENIMVANDANIIVMGQNGEFRYLENNGYFELLSNNINYVYSNGAASIEKVEGVMLNPPSGSIMDSYYDSMHFIEKNEKVLFILVDGFSFQQYLKAVENNSAPFLASMKKASQASSVYKPISNVGLAAITTGKTPEENGIYKKDQRDLKVTSIFGELQQMGKNSSIIEGDIQIIKTEIDPVLNVDSNNNGTKDDEIFESAFANLQKGYDFLLVHFHGVDENGQNYGDMSGNTMKAINKIDNYISQLAQNWHGKIIMTSDHGIHSTGSGGYHGDFRFEDLIVPYLIFEGGM